MQENDPIVALTHKLEALIAKTVSIESLDGKLTDLVHKFDAVAATLDETHRLVNSRMTSLTAALEKAAVLAAALAGERGEKRGIAIGRAQAADEQPGTGDG